MQQKTVVQKLDLITSTVLYMLTTTCSKGQMLLLKHIEFLWRQDHQTPAEKIPMDPPFSKSFFFKDPLSQSCAAEIAKKISSDET